MVSCENNINEENNKKLTKSEVGSPSQSSDSDSMTPNLIKRSSSHKKSMFAPKLI